MDIHAPVLKKSMEAYQISRTQIISSYHLNTGEKEKAVNTKTKAKTSTLAGTTQPCEPVLI